MELVTEMKAEKTGKRIWIWTCGVILFIFAGLLTILTRGADGFAQWYSETVYRMLTETVGRVMGIFPFSVAEILLYILLLWLLFSVGRIIWNLAHRKNGRAADFAGELFFLAALLAFLYTAACGVNYYRTSFAECTGLQIDGYSTEQLAAVCMALTADLNRAAEVVSRDADGIMVCSENISQSSASVMKQLSEEWPMLQGHYPKAKKLLVPWILSVQKVTGIYSPFTIEANYNGDITDYNIPFTACHELSHLRGYMREEEANFIAWLACRNSEQPDYQYSGSLRGWISCMNVLYRADQDVWMAIRVQLNPAVEADIAANRDYWAKFEGPVADAAQAVNDNYLKANGQSDGIQSYGRMADLIVAYYIKNTL